MATNRGVNRTRTIEEAERFYRPDTSAKARKRQADEREKQRATLANQMAQVRAVEEETAGLPRLPDGTILGPDGRPLLRAVRTDFSKTIYEGAPGDPIKMYAIDILKRAARMQRDGASLDRIASELQIESIVPLSMLEQALINVGHPLLEADIKAGIEPEETVVTTGYEFVDDGSEPGDDDAFTYVAPDIPQRGAR